MAEPMAVPSKPNRTQPLSRLSVLKAPCCSVAHSVTTPGYQHLVIDVQHVEDRRRHEFLRVGAESDLPADLVSSGAAAIHVEGEESEDSGKPAFTDPIPRAPHLPGHGRTSRY